MIGTDLAAGDAAALAEEVRSGRLRALDIVAAYLHKIEHLDPQLNCFTEVTAHSAREQAAEIDRRIAAGRDAGPLAGVPFAVKNLFDVAGLTTLGGSKIHADNPPAVRDATAIGRLKKAGAILMGTLNMDEYAYGFTTENTHYGPTRNPHDLERVAGGSSGGSAAAVAADLVPLSLGTDTNGSIRVPASFCGVFGLKPTYGRISRAGALLFSESLDHVGPLARSVHDLACAFDALHGPDPMDPVCSDRPPEPCLPVLEHGIDDLQIAVADGYFARHGGTEGADPVLQAAKTLGVIRTVTILDAEKARAAAYVITACEGSNRHLRDLKRRPQDFDPVVIERFLAGALLPAAWYAHAQRFRRVFREHMREIFRTVDVILAPATPCAAIKIGQPTITLDGVKMASRPNLGIFTQPLSYVGLPIVCAPIFESGRLPLGIQIIAAPYREAAALRVARVLEGSGLSVAPAIPFL